MSPNSLSSAPWPARVAFITELAERLHAYGTTAQRLEGALLAVSSRLSVECEPWINPTGMILTFRDPDDPNTNDITRVIRLPPGDTDLCRLVRVDRIAEDVLTGRIGIIKGHAELERLDRVPTRRWQLMQVLAFSMVAGGVAMLLRMPWLDVATATFAGLCIGLLDYAVSRQPLLRESMEALAAMLAATLAVLVAGLIAPLNLNTVIIASVIVLLPGMALTNAINELTSQHLVAGTARFAGAVSTILKLTIGTMIALTMAEWSGLEPMVLFSRPQPFWVEGLGLLVSCYAFAVAFRASRRDYPLVMCAAAAGYLISRLAGEAMGSAVGVFLSALGLTVAGNLYARFSNRPGALIRVPGIILLVPGSVSFRGLMTLMQQQDMSAGQAALMAVLNILLALIAGLMFGNLLAPPRRNL
ncbi:threonine/serine exporter family protein [Lysobacter pythonis]|uniref:Threonine/serine exporter family protein n=1 Tax=Solilutibacter pythonis TaxID=2483112 RepID=A0A3M2I4Z3_9GAMM|nr:threonine/serine exporter family protein [Lysobacter pythonis]RMH93324.1 threonine/serine exporter family protein [Lysobacter pythonis]